MSAFKWTSSRILRVNQTLSFNNVERKTSKLTYILVFTLYDIHQLWTFIHQVPSEKLCPRCGSRVLENMATHFVYLLADHIQGSSQAPSISNSLTIRGLSNINLILSVFPDGLQAALGFDIVRNLPFKRLIWSNRYFTYQYAPVLDPASRYGCRYWINSLRPKLRYFLIRSLIQERGHCYLYHILSLA